MVHKHGRYVDFKTLIKIFIKAAFIELTLFKNTLFAEAQVFCILFYVDTINVPQ